MTHRYLRREENSPPPPSSLHSFWQEARSLTLPNPPTIPTLPTPPKPLTFLRHFLSANTPLLISSAVPHWPALHLWPPSSTSSAAVSLHLTPTGKADALTPHITTPQSLCFASSHVVTLPFEKALEVVRTNKYNDHGVVGYLQQQNDCLRTEYGDLIKDCEEDVPWATEAIGCGPEAVNLWIGNEKSETWFHKDHYENLYVVVSGEKRFLLVPPWEVHRMYVKEYPAARYNYHEDCGEFTLDLEDPVSYVPWCSVDPYPSPDEKQMSIEKFPLYFNGPKPYEVTVKAGQMLYLPSMWFHHVKQVPDENGLCIAVNYWYDMQFDIKYAYFNFLKSIPRSLLNDPKLSKNTNTGLASAIESSGNESDMTTLQEIRDESDDQEE